MRGSLITTSAVLVTIGIGIGSLVAAGDASIVTSSSALAAPKKVVAITLPTNYQFSSVIPDGRSVELVGASGLFGTSCASALLDTTSLSLNSFETTNCATPFSGVPSTQPVSAVVVDPFTQHSGVEIARRDPTTGKISDGPVVMTFSDSSDTHLEQIYGDGALWVFDSATPDKGLLLRISPTTGQVENSIVVPDDPYRALLAVNNDGLWMAVAVNGRYDSQTAHTLSPIYHVASGSNTATIVHRRGYAALWIKAAGHKVWVDDLVAPPIVTQGVIQRLLAFTGPTSRPLVDDNVSNLTFVSAATNSTGGLWTTTMPKAGVADCVSRQRVSVTNPPTEPQSQVAVLPSEPESAPYSCEQVNSQQSSAFVDGSLYVLYQSHFYGGGGYDKLYRITP